VNTPLAGLLVRRMTLADLDRVIEIERSLTAAPHWPRSAYLAALDSRSSPPRIALVAEIPESCVLGGFALASLLPPQSELESIAVAAELQRHGMASQLFSVLAAELRKARVEVVFLEVRASNQPAEEFYRRLRFEETARRPRYYHDPVEDAILMSLRL